MDGHELKELEKFIVCSYKRGLGDIIKGRIRTTKVNPILDKNNLKGIASQILPIVLQLEDESTNWVKEDCAVMNAKSVIRQYGHIKRRNPEIIPAWMEQKIYWMIRILSGVEARKIRELEQSGITLKAWEINVLLFKDAKYRMILNSNLNRIIKKEYFLRKRIENIII